MDAAPLGAKSRRDYLYTSLSCGALEESERILKIMRHVQNRRTRASPCQATPSVGSTGFVARTK
jgi:hypothetical protein